MSCQPFLKILEKKITFCISCAPQLFFFFILLRSPPHTHTHKNCCHALFHFVTDMSEIKRCFALSWARMTSRYQRPCCSYRLLPFFAATSWKDWGTGTTLPGLLEAPIMGPFITSILSHLAKQFVFILMAVIAWLNCSVPPLVYFCELWNLQPCLMVRRVQQMQVRMMCF